jgi:hypothetical protein
MGMAASSSTLFRGAYTRTWSIGMKNIHNLLQDASSGPSVTLSPLFLHNHFSVLNLERHGAAVFPGMDVR